MTEGSRALKKTSSNLLPRYYIGRVLLVMSDAAVEFGTLRICQEGSVRFKAFPYCIQQVGFFFD